MRGFKMKKIVLDLDNEEKELENSLNKGEWKSVKNLKSEINNYQSIAKNTIKKNRRINIRMSGRDIEKIQIMALEEGIPYQTFISSILHKYINGNLKKVLK